MSDEMRAKDPGAIWRDQPGEEVTVNLKQIVSRRTEELSSSTRSEILMSIRGGAALRRGDGLADRAARPSAVGWIRRGDRMGGDLPDLVPPPHLEAGELRVRTRWPRPGWNITEGSWNGGAITC